MSQFEQYMVALPKPFNYRAVVFGDGAVRAICLVLAGALGVPVHEVWATPAAGFGEGRVNQVWTFSHGEDSWSWNPTRVARKPRGKTEAARAVEVARFRGDPELSLGMEARP